MMPPRTVAMVALLAFAFLGRCPALAEPIDPGSLRVLDGDTVAVAGITYRLVGFDAPEQGTRAKCVAEAALAECASSRLRAIVAAGGLDLARVDCACRPSTEGTPFCNFGRLCAALRSGGKDVAEIMIREGLAHPLVCGRTRCPRRDPWC